VTYFDLYVTRILAAVSTQLAT